jgi:DnaJ-domain-containing protein 1
MLGFGTMRQLHEARHGKAVMKSMQQQLQSEEEGGDSTAEGAEVEVLDIMDSLKEQFESLQEKYKNYRQGKSKYKTGMLASDIANNKSIFEFMSP